MPAFTYVNCYSGEYRGSGTGNNTNHASPYGAVSLHSVQRSATNSQQADPSHCSLYVISRDPRFHFMTNIKEHFHPNGSVKRDEIHKTLHKWLFHCD